MGVPVEKANDYSYFLVYLQSLHRLSRSPSLYTREARGGMCCRKKGVVYLYQQICDYPSVTHSYVTSPHKGRQEWGCTCVTMGEYCGRALRPAPTKFYIHKREDLRPLLFYPHIYFLFFFSSFSMILLYGISIPSVIFPFIFF